MSDPQSYTILSSDQVAELRIKGSRFIAYARHTADRPAAKAHLEEIRALHPKATHHCSACTWGLVEDRREYESDDGEPSGTAGKPILNVLKSLNLSECSVVVVRYYGGTKLGTSGLIRAYRDTARLCLEGAQLATKLISRKYRLEFEYDVMPQMLSLIDRQKIQVIDKDFSAKAAITLELPLDQIVDTMRQLYCTANNLYESEVIDEKLEEWIEARRI